MCLCPEKQFMRGFVYSFFQLSSYHTEFSLYIFDYYRFSWYCMHGIVKCPEKVPGQGPGGCLEYLQYQRKALEVFHLSLLLFFENQ